ncbi:hypothetical protein PR048_024064 [Dryococelus australis]|uniref:Uncharacterized protein n=1 Tax=Dryococelus australis TaxID=614101 RepID=A0ABQ9GVU4_9NEOP|nr:hypothetical protein PR048_024064 [Dryococelus australis]
MSIDPDLKIKRSSIFYRRGTVKDAVHFTKPRTVDAVRDAIVTTCVSTLTETAATDCRFVLHRCRLSLTTRLPPGRTCFYSRRGSIPGFSHVGIVSGEAAGRRDWASELHAHCLGSKRHLYTSVIMSLEYNMIPSVAADVAGSDVQSSHWFVPGDSVPKLWVLVSRVPKEARGRQQRLDGSSRDGFCPLAPRGVSVLAEVVLGHLRYDLRDLLPPRASSPPGFALGSDHAGVYAGLSKVLIQPGPAFACVYYSGKTGWSATCKLIPTATSCGYNSSHPVWHALYECLQDIHGDSSPFLLQPFHELSNGFWPRLTSPHPEIQFVPKMFYWVEVGALGGQSNRQTLLSAYHCIPNTQSWRLFQSAPASSQERRQIVFQSRNEEFGGIKRRKTPPINPQNLGLNACPRVDVVYSTATSPQSCEMSAGIRRFYTTSPALTDNQVYAFERQNSPFLYFILLLLLLLHLRSLFAPQFARRYRLTSYRQGWIRTEGANKSSALELVRHRTRVANRPVLYGISPIPALKELSRIDWLDYSTPTYVNRVRFSAGLLPDSSMREALRTMPLIGGFFSENSRFPRSLIPALIHTHFTAPSSALTNSVLRAVQISPPSNPTWDRNLWDKLRREELQQDSYACLICFHKCHYFRANPLRLLGREIMQRDRHRGKEGLGSHGLHFGAMTTSLSVLRASLNYEERGKNRQERRKNPCDREAQIPNRSSRNESVSIFTDQEMPLQPVRSEFTVRWGQMTRESRNKCRYWRATGPSYIVAPSDGATRLVRASAAWVAGARGTDLPSHSRDRRPMSAATAHACVGGDHLVRTRRWYMNEWVAPHAHAQKPLARRSADAHRATGAQSTLASAGLTTEISYVHTSSRNRGFAGLTGGLSALRRDVQGVLTSGLCVLCGLVRETSSARREIPSGWYKGPSTPPL